MSTTANSEQLRFPVGRWVRPDDYDPSMRRSQLETIAAFPATISRETGHLSNEQLDTLYRPGGWTIRQVVHHCADSHMNSLIRFKLALTEDFPTIKPYLEDKWGEHADNKTMPVSVSLQILEGLHARWVTLMNAMTENEWQMGFIHPEHKQPLKLYQVLHLYAWHCVHHLAHITELKKRKGWI
jgi:hypothetical protein